MKTMKNIPTFEEFVNENINEATGLSADFDNPKDLLNAVKKLPDTIKYIKVQSSLSEFQPSMEEISPADKNWKKQVEDIVKSVLKLKGAEDIDKFKLLSYFGAGRPTDPYYIAFSTEKSRDFADRMGRGEYGKLD
jgi:hypothetical protein